MEDAELVSALDREEDELDRLDPVPDTIMLECGIEVHVLPLRTRQLFKMLRIITHGAGQALAQSGLDFGDEPGVFMQKLVSLVLFSIPDAEQETIDFIQSMVEPAGLVDLPPRDLSEKQRARNVELWTELNKELWNPDPNDTISLVENFVKREAADLQALGKRISQFLKLADKTGQLKNKSNGGGKRSSQELNLPESSPASSTSSATPTGGRTSASKTSRSGGSARSSRPSPRGSTRKSAPAAQ